MIGTAAPRALDEEEVAAAVPMENGDDPRAFLEALATLLRETVLRFEETVGQITHKVTSNGAQPDRDLIVTLQNFDLLQQEFAALGNTLALYAATANRRIAARDDRHPRDVIATISIADLQDRFLKRLYGESVSTADALAEGEEIF